MKDNMSEQKELTPMQEIIIHLQTKFGFNFSKEDFSFWLDKECKSLRKAYDEGIEDGGFFGIGKDYVDRTYMK
jgi:hypothetical protein